MGRGLAAPPKNPIPALDLLGLACPHPLLSTPRTKILATAPTANMTVRLAADLRPSTDESAVRIYLVDGGGYSLGQLRA